MRYYNENNNFNLQNALLEAIETYNNKLQSCTESKRIDLINLKDAELINSIIKKIKNNDNKKNLEYQELEEYTHVLIKKECINAGKRL